MWESFTKEKKVILGLSFFEETKDKEEVGKPKKRVHCPKNKR